MFKNLYSLNVFYSNIEGIDNKELTRICVAAASRKAASVKSNTGYTDVPVDGTNKEIIRLRKTIKSVMHEHIDQRLVEAEMWTHVMQPGETTMIHSHRNKLDWGFLGLSWVYYPQMPEGENIGGKIIYQIQIGGIKTINKDFTPKTGMFIIFPSWLPHFSTRCTSQETRISISGNYRFNDERLYDEVAHDPNSGIKKLTGF